MINDQLFYRFHLKFDFHFYMETRFQINSIKQMNKFYLIKIINSLAICFANVKLANLIKRQLSPLRWFPNDEEDNGQTSITAVANVFHFLTSNVFRFSHYFSPRHSSHFYLHFSWPFVIFVWKTNPWWSEDEFLICNIAGLNFILTLSSVGLDGGDDAPHCLCSMS